MFVVPVIRFAVRFPSCPARVFSGQQRFFWGFGRREKKEPTLLRRGPTIVPFEHIKVGCWYEARPILPEMDPITAMHSKLHDRKGPGALVGQLIPHRVLVIGINPAWRIVRYADITTNAGLGPVDWGKEKGLHPVEARRFVPIGGVPKLFEGLRAQAFPNVIHGYLRLDAVCTSQYGIGEEMELTYLPEAVRLTKGSLDEPAMFSTIESPPWVLDYIKDMSRAWADNIYGGKGYDGVEDLKVEFSKIAAIYTPQAEAIAQQAREIAQAEREKAAEAMRLEKQQQNKWRMSRAFWGTSGLRARWLSSPNPLKIRRVRARRRGKSRKQKQQQKTPPPESEAARKRRLMWERAARAAPEKLPSRIIKTELKPDSVVVMNSWSKKPPGNSWMLGAVSTAYEEQGGKKQDKGQRDDGGEDDDDDDAFFYGPIRDEGHVQS